MNIHSDIRNALQGTIAQPEPNHYTAEFAFASEHPIFKGHFPEYPLVPGVYLLQSLWQVAELIPGRAWSLKSVRSAKFQAQVRPPCSYTADVKIQEQAGRCLIRGEIIHAGGIAVQAVFECGVKSES
jgi:3-hydroxyacyl-[acyl-carrier-protein] dehydratase